MGLIGVAFAGFARADDAPVTPGPDKSGFTLFNPTPTDDLRSLCTDRPTKSSSPCTVDAGHWQVESDIYNWTQQRVRGVTTTTVLFTNPTLKLGVTNTLDLEVNVPPHERVTVHDSNTGLTTTGAGVGDLFLRAKWSLIGDDGGSFGFAVAPFVKVLRRDIHEHGDQAQCPDGARHASDSFKHSDADPSMQRWRRTHRPRQGEAQGEEG